MKPGRLALMAAAACLAISATLWAVLGLRPADEGDIEAVEVPAAAPVADPLAPESMREAAVSMAGYLVRKTDENGKFDYRVNIDPNLRVTRSYNELRHAGTIYSMVDAQLTAPDDKLHDAILRAARFLKREIIEPVPGQEGMLAAWSKPKLTREKHPMEAKLGGTGLALVALLSVEKMKPGETPLEDLQALGRFLVFMQKEDGGYFSKFIPPDEGRSDKFMSLYYPGEAALGLVMLSEKDGSAEWLNSAAKALAYLAHLRKGMKQVEADHWALLATAQLLPHYEKTDGSVPRELLVSHAVQVCESMLSERPNHPQGSLLHGCFTQDGRTTPTATRLEGLQAGLKVLPPESDKLRKRIEDAVRDGIRFLLRSRVVGTDFDGAIPRAIDTLPLTIPQARSFNERATEVRIDYVQHALSALLEYERGRKQSPGT